MGGLFDFGQSSGLAYAFASVGLALGLAGVGFLSAALLAERDIKEVLLVSERYHLHRARLLFGRAGLVVAAAVAPPGDWRRDWPMWLREAIALPHSLWQARRRRSAPARARVMHYRV